MKNKIYIGVALTILLTGGYLVYNKFLKKQKRTKQENIAIIVENNYSRNVNNALSSFEPDFLNEWANAILLENKSFNYKGKNYNTQGGTAIKN